MKKIQHSHISQEAKQVQKETFRSIVKSTPLVSIDLILRNSLGQILLGERLNRPAQGYWFVPGGRILKDETMKDAFKRLMREELGLSHDFNETEFRGLFEHFYPDNFAGADFSTHYVVLAFELTADVDIHALPLQQHGKYRWFEVNELLGTSEVHRHTKWYFS